jgi:hypothetical protein
MNHCKRGVGGDYGVLGGKSGEAYGVIDFRIGT